MALRPKAVTPILALGGNGLNGFPAQKGVVADERCRFARPDGKADSAVNLVGEECDSIFEVVAYDLHDAGGVLHDGYFRGEVHFGGAVEEAVHWDAGV